MRNLFCLILFILVPFSHLSVVFSQTNQSDSFEYYPASVSLPVSSFENEKIEEEIKYHAPFYLVHPLKSRRQVILIKRIGNYINFMHCIVLGESFNLNNALDFADVPCEYLSSYFIDIIEPANRFLPSVQDRFIEAFRKSLSRTLEKTDDFIIKDEYYRKIITVLTESFRASVKFAGAAALYWYASHSPFHASFLSAKAQLRVSRVIKVGAWFYAINVAFDVWEVWKNNQEYESLVAQERSFELNHLIESFDEENFFQNEDYSQPVLDIMKNITDSLTEAMEDIVSLSGGA